jgi:hypothetical protein
MLSKTSVVLSTLHNVQEFMTTNAGALGGLNTSESRRALDDLEAALTGHATSQTRSKSGGKAAVARQRVLKSALLVKYLRPISAIAEAQLSQSPDFVEMKLPKGLKTTPQLLAAAAAMAGAAGKHVDTFVAAGMQPTFIADLEAAAAQLKGGSVTKGSTLSKQIGATSALKASTKEAHKIVKQLDALVVPLLAGNTALLTQWKATKRFAGRVQGIANATISSTGTTSAPVTSNPAAGSSAAVAEPAPPPVAPAVA